MRMYKIRHQYAIFDAILTPSGKFPLHLTFRRHLPVTMADVFVLIRSYMQKKPAVKTAGGTCRDGVLMATMRCARRHARGHQHQRCRHGVGLLVDYLFCGRIMQFQARKLSRDILARASPTCFSRLRNNNIYLTTKSSMSNCKIAALVV